MEIKILAASPTYEGMKYCDEKFIESIKNLTYPNYDILIVDNSRNKDYFKRLSKIKGIKVIYDDTTEEKSTFRLISSRNKILKYAIDNQYTHILMLDSDVIIPNNVIEELLKSDKPLVTGLYNNYFNISGESKFLPVAWKFFSEVEFQELKRKYPHMSKFKNRTDLRRHLTQEEVDSNELHHVAYPSAGCALIRREVFEKVKYGYPQKEGMRFFTGDDIYFVDKARELGYEPYCNTKVKCKHLVLGKYEKDENGNLVLKGFSDMLKS